MGPVSTSQSAGTEITETFYEASGKRLIHADLLTFAFLKPSLPLLLILGGFYFISESSENITRPI